MQLTVRLDKRPNTLIDCAAHLAEHAPDRTAVTLVTPDGEQAITYREFFDRSARYASALEKTGVQSGDLVVLVLRHSDAVLYSFWGAMLLGAIPSIMPFLTPKLDPAHYYDTIQKLVELSAVKAVITCPDQQPGLEHHLTGIDTLAAIINVEDLESESELANYLERVPFRPDSTAFLQHSSGSTGLQKGVMLSHDAVLNQIAAYSAAIDLTSDDVIVSWLPLYHDMGLIAAFVMPMVQGVPLVLMSPFQWVRSPEVLLHTIDRYQATLCWLPNFAYNFMVTRVRQSTLGSLSLGSMRAFINCSEPVRADSHAMFAERYADYELATGTLHTCYAMAENTFAVTQSDLGQPPTVDTVDRDTIMEQHRAEPVPVDSKRARMTMVSCGTPIPNTEIRIVDAERRPLPERHVGEIALRSDCMLSGYYRRPEATAEALQGEWYYTGDLGYLAGGELYITGRRKDLIIVGGKNVYPQDIENLLNDIPGVHPGRTVAFGVFSEQLGTEDVAVIVEADTDDPVVHKQIASEIRMRVAQATDVMARYVQLVEPQWLLKTSSGKIARAANHDRFLCEILNRAHDH